MGLFDDIVQSVGGGGLSSGIGAAMAVFQRIMLGLIILVVVGGVVVFILIRRRTAKSYNIPLIIVTPRSDGRVVEISRGVGGFFKSKKVGGITSFRVKRKGISTVDIPPPESVYLASPDRTLILAQKGIDDYEPVLPNSLNMVETPEGKQVAILDLKAKNQDATAWAFDNEETAKRRFTFISFWDKYQSLISMMMFIFILFLVLYINWLGMKDVVSGLKEVAEILGKTTQPIISPS